MNTTFTIKSARIDAFSLLLHSTDESLLEQELRQFFASRPEFHEMPFVLDMGAMSTPSTDLITRILKWCQEYSIHFVGVYEHPDLNSEEIRTSHLTVLPRNNRFRQPEIISVVDTISAPKSELQEARPTLIIDKPVRSGERIYADHADIICTALVSHGAEVVADGNIHIYAPLRGRAMAGESGNKNARIFVQSMQAELVSVAGVYRNFDRQLPDSLYRHAVSVSLQNNQLNIAAISSEEKGQDNDKSHRSNLWQRWRR